MRSATKLRAVISDGREHDHVPAPGQGSGLDLDHDQLAVQQAWAALLPHSRDIADEISRDLLAHCEPGLEVASPQFDAEVRAATRDHVQSGLRSLAGVEGAEHRAVDVWREFGRQQARRGVPLDTIANSYIRANRVLWDALLTRHRDGDTGSAVDEGTLLQAGRALWDCMDIQNAVLGSAYRQERAALSEGDDGLCAEALDGLLDGRGADVDFAREAGRILGIPAGAPVTCVVGINLAGVPGPPRRPSGSLARLGVTAHWHVRDGRLIGLLAHPQRTLDELRDGLRPLQVGRLALMQSDDGVEGFATAHRLAARAADTLPQDTAAVECATDLLPQVLLAGNREITHLLVEQVLGRLMAQPAHQRQVLLETLGAYITSGLSPTRTADLLTCHRNTVIYRMRQVAELTDHDPHRPEDLLPLSLALLAVQALPYRSPATPSRSGELASAGGHTVFSPSAPPPLRAVRR